MIGEYYERKDLKVGMVVDIHRLDKIRNYPIFFSLSSIERRKDLPYGRGTIVGLGKMPSVVPKGGLFVWNELPDSTETEIYEEE